MTLSEYDQQWCMKQLNDLVKNPLSMPFRVPVDPERDGAPTYFDIVKNPMDLSTIRKKLQDGKYHSANEFVEDIHLICSNAIAFNGTDSMYAYIAEDLRDSIDHQLSKKANSIEEEWQRRLSDVIAKLSEHVKNSPLNSQQQDTTVPEKQEAAGESEQK